MNIERIKAKVEENIDSGKEQYEGMESSDIGAYNRHLMFGDTTEGWDDDEWSAIVD